MPLAEDGMKTCTQCGTTKPIEDFGVDRQKPDGLFTWCKLCSRAKSLAYRNANVEKTRASVAKWKADNPDRVRETQRRHYEANKDMYREYVKTYRGRHPERVKRAARISHLLTKYGITVERYDEMLLAQRGGCAICAAPPPENGVLCVDHCHASGAVRGLLCQDCNRGIGYMRDDPRRLAKAAKYLSAAARC